MPHELRPAVIFAMAYFLILVGLAAVSVYVFGVYERAWGRGGSWQVLTWIAAGSTVLAFFGALSGSTVARRRGRALSLLRTLLAAIVASLVLLCALYVSAPVGQTVGLWGIAVASVVLPMLACAMLSKPANPTIERDAPQAARPSL